MYLLYLYPAVSHRLKAAYINFDNKAVRWPDIAKLISTFPSLCQNALKIYLDFKLNLHWISLCLLEMGSNVT